MRKLVPPFNPFAPAFRIRPAEAADMPALMEIERLAFRHPWSPDLLKRELTHDWSTILLAEEGEAPASPLGFAICWVVHDELHILNVATAPAHQRRGVARAVLKTALQEAQERRCSLATLEVRRSNEAAIGLYRDLGFRPVGVRTNYYTEEGEDAIVMVLDF